MRTLNQGQNCVVPFPGSQMSAGLHSSTLGNHCGNSRSLSPFSTSQLFWHEATFFVAKIFDNRKYKKHATNKIRSSHPEVFCKECVLRNFAKFTGKHKCQSFFFNKVAVPQVCEFVKIENLAQVFSCEFCAVYKGTFFHRTPLAAAFVKYNLC